MSLPSSERRSFLSRLKTGLTSFVAVGGVAMAQVKSPGKTLWEPARHDKDDWLDQLPGKHRLVFDTTTPAGLGEALLFANNFMLVNRSAYGLQNSDLAVVIVVRHHSTVFGYSDKIWAKYGTPLGSAASFEDPKSKRAPQTNLYNSGDYAELLANRGTTLDSLFKQGIQLAVCAMATRGVAGLVAKAVDGNADAINSELTTNLVSNARMVPAGIVAVNRAQERGYSLVTS